LIPVAPSGPPAGGPRSGLGLPNRRRRARAARRPGMAVPTLALGSARGFAVWPCPPAAPPSPPSAGATRHCDVFRTAWRCAAADPRSSVPDRGSLAEERCV
jgi:hypothetical protein